MAESVKVPVWKKRRILYVDDDPRLLKTFSAILALHGFNVETASSPAEAAQKLNANNYDMVVSDLCMDGKLVGGEVIKTAKEKRCKTVIYTAYPSKAPPGEYVFEKAASEVSVSQQIEHLAQRISDILNGKEPTPLPRPIETHYYADPLLAHIKQFVDREVLNHNRQLRASHLTENYRLPTALVQAVLGDLVAIGDLQPHYQVFCSGKGHDDREFTNLADIPKDEIKCHTCRDSYQPADENIMVWFEPTSDYLSALGVVP